MKRATAQDKQNTYQPDGGTLQIYWDEQTEHRQTDEGTETIYSYAFAQTKTGAARDQLIEDIIRSQYTTGAEFAAINNGGDQYEAYQAFRATAKALADGWLEELRDGRSHAN